MIVNPEKYIDLDGQELTKNTLGGGSIWYRNKQNEFHRMDGPAYEGANGYVAWYKQGKYHREDGPAKIYSDGKEEYRLNGREVSKRDIDLLWLKKQVQQ